MIETNKTPGGDATSSWYKQINHALKGHIMNLQIELIKYYNFKKEQYNLMKLVSEANVLDG